MGSNWQTVTLPSSYTSMVVVASPEYDSSSAPAVVRIRNASGNSFEIRVDPAGPSPVTSMDVHYTVLEEGVYDQPGYKLEAVKFISTVTDENNSWAGQSRSYQQSYSAPVVVGQVMSYNDPDWSVFWAAGGSRTAAPSSSTLTVGKHVGEDSDTTRADETIGYIVIETNTSGTAEIEGLPYVAAVGGDSIKGVGDSPSYNYTYAAMANSKTALVSQAGMDGGNGGWAVLYGDTSITPTGNTLKLAIDEDQSKDTERKHTTEQVAYLIIDPPSARLDAAAVSADSTPLPFTVVDSKRHGISNLPASRVLVDSVGQRTNDEYAVVLLASARLDASPLDLASTGGHKSELALSPTVTMGNSQLAPPTYVPTSSARDRFFSRYSGEVSHEGIELDDETVDSVFLDAQLLEDLISSNSGLF